ncbi:MAG: MazG family protein [Streptomycetales bacterium]
MSGRLVFLVTSHRVAPGLLSWTAWEVLRTADRVRAGSPDHPLLPAVREAGVRVETLDAAGLPAAALARQLLDAAAEGTVAWLAAEDGDPELGDALAHLAAAEADSGVKLPEIEMLAGSYDVPGARLLDLVAVMDRLRTSCPWDRRQTHESLVGHLIEEAYEMVDAIETGNRAELREELGDVLLQVAFHSRIAAEHPDDPWSVDDVAADIVDKLVSRHPHVFGDVEADTPEQVKANWDELKKAEKGRTSAVQGVPPGQPALALAAKLMTRARKAGVAVEVTTPIEAPQSVGDTTIGALLLAVVALAREHGVDPEGALRRAARGYRDRVQAAESGD